MSSYFDALTVRVSEASSQNPDDNRAFLVEVSKIEEDLIRDVTEAIHDHEFPDDLRTKVRLLFAECDVTTSARAAKYATVLRVSELVEKTHSLFHEIAGRRVQTRFGMLDDNPRGIWQRRRAHDNG